MAGIGTPQLRPPDEVLLRVEHLTVHFRARGGQTVQAVSDVSFDVAERETLSLVGESGCGKSSTGRAVVQLPPPTSGSVRFEGRELTNLRGGPLRQVRSRLQIILQDPISSLNPRRRIRDVVAEPLTIQKRTGEDRVDEALDAVGLDPALVGSRRPHEFSGGQCQRICIARALVADPAILICDEPVSALDVSVQGQILNLLEELKQRYGLSLVFVSHDLAVVKNVSDRVAVMYLGRLCELAPPDTLYRHPRHPYTVGLLEAVPDPDPTVRPYGRATVTGEVPSPIRPPSGCRFRTRCPRAQARCAAEVPEMTQIGDDHWVACHFPVTETSPPVPKWNAVT